jgi:hypothetical protein
VICIPWLVVRAAVIECKTSSVLEYDSAACMGSE